MLRAAGKLNNTSNKQAMRDLSGRRQRFIEQEKELAEWLKEQKTTKPMTEREIQADFRHIKQYGTLPEKRMCHRGVRCRYREKCKFRHPDDADINAPRTKSTKPRVSDEHLFSGHTQTDEEMLNALKMGQIHHKQLTTEYKLRKEMKRDVVPLFGDELTADNAESEVNGQDTGNGLKSLKSLQSQHLQNRREIQHQSHDHKLHWTLREDCDFIICDLCSKCYIGPSWHCEDGCDFDVCDDCVEVDESMNIEKDVHLMRYQQRSETMKEIESADIETMEVRSFSKSVGRKRKRKERQLGLLGLENRKHPVHRETRKDITPGIGTGNGANGCIREQRLRGELGARGMRVKDPNEIMVDIDLLFPASMIMTKSPSMQNDEIKKKRKLKEMAVKGKIDLNVIENVEELENIGLDALKAELQIYGMKCSGNLRQRAERLFLLKEHDFCDLPKHCFAVKKKGKKNRKRQKT